MRIKSLFVFAIAIALAFGGVIHAQPIELTVLTHYSTHQEESLLHWINLWNEANPDIQVRHQSVDFDNLLPTIMAQQTAGRSADIVHGYALWAGQMARSNVLAAPSPEVLRDIEENFAPAGVEGITVGGEILGYPTEVQTYGLFYNKMLLEEAGYSAPPKTWDELYEMAKALTRYNERGELEVAGFGLMSGWDSAVVHPFLSLAYAAGAEFLNEDGTAVRINSDAGVQALIFQEGMIKEDIIDISLNVLGAFPQQRMAMTINAGWWNGSLRVGMEENYTNIGVAQIPGPTEEDRGSVAYSWFFGVNQRSRNQEAAWKFLQWLNSVPQENGATAFGNFMVGLGIIPSRHSDLVALENELAHPNNQPFIEALQYAVPEPNVFAGQRIKTILQREIEAVWSGQLSAENALNRASQQITRELAR